MNRILNILLISGLWLSIVQSMEMESANVLPSKSLYGYFADMVSKHPKTAVAIASLVSAALVTGGIYLKFYHKKSTPTDKSSQQPSPQQITAMPSASFTKTTADNKAGLSFFLYKQNPVEKDGKYSVVSYPKTQTMLSSKNLWKDAENKPCFAPFMVLQGYDEYDKDETDMRFNENFEDKFTVRLEGKLKHIPNNDKRELSISNAIKNTIQEVERGLRRQKVQGRSTFTMLLFDMCSNSAFYVTIGTSCLILGATAEQNWSYDPYAVENEDGSAQYRLIDEDNDKYANKKYWKKLQKKFKIDEKDNNLLNNKLMQHMFMADDFRTKIGQTAFYAEGIKTMPEAIDVSYIDQVIEKNRSELDSSDLGALVPEYDSFIGNYAQLTKRSFEVKCINMENLRYIKWFALISRTVLAHKSLSGKYVDVILQHNQYKSAPTQEQKKFGDAGLSQDAIQDTIRQIGEIGDQIADDFEDGKKLLERTVTSKKLLEPSVFMLIKNPFFQDSEKEIEEETKD